MCLIYHIRSVKFYTFVNKTTWFKLRGKMFTKLYCTIKYIQIVIDILNSNQLFIYHLYLKILQQNLNTC